MPWKPSEPGEVPTLGYLVIEWISEYLAAPDRADYEPFTLYVEQEDFVLRYYELDPRTGQRRRRRGVYSRPRGHGKSPFLGAIAIAEGLGPVVPAGWDAHGQPVGKPWSEVRTPLVQVAAVSETQTKNTWTPLLEMLRDGPVLDEYPGIEPLDTFVNLPSGRIEPITSSARTVKGNRAVFAVLDQTEEWVSSNGGLRLAETMRINAAKVGGSTIESPNAYTPGEDSVAEQSASYWSAICEGKARDDGLFYDHREAPPDTDLADRESLMAGLRYAYGDSSGHLSGCVIHQPPCPPGHVDMDVIAATVWDPAIDPQRARADFLNQITHASDAWISQPDWAARRDLEKVIGKSDPVVLGFDGSRGRSRGKADATALVGCRIADGHLFELRVWEQPEGPAGRDWLPNVLEVDAEVDDAFAKYNVVGFYADPSHWSEQVARWEASYGSRLRVKASHDHPIAAWPRGKDSRVVEYVERLRVALATGEATHNGGAALTRHALNARRRSTRTGYLLFKEFPESPRKIDAAYAAVMAWKARIDALSAGVGSEPKRRAPRRIR
jgi:hypothetical protein